MRPMKWIEFDSICVASSAFYVIFNIKAFTYLILVPVQILVNKNFTNWHHRQQSAI